MKILVFILLNIVCMNLSLAAPLTAPSQAEYSQAAVSVMEYLELFKDVSATVECEDYRSSIIVCSASYYVTVVDSIDLEEDGIREESYDLKCADTYTFDRLTADIQELESECY